MSILLGNLGFNVALGLQFRVFLVPWVKRNSQVLCLKEDRDYSSSVPIRYTPKESSKTDELEDSPRLKDWRRNGSHGSSSSGASGNRPPRSSILMGKSFIFEQKSREHIELAKSSLSYENAEEDLEVADDLRFADNDILEEPWDVEEKIKTPEEKDIHKQELLVAGKKMKDAEKLAVELLAGRAFTTVELRKKLQGKKFPSAVIESVIDNLRGRGYINDSLYAETFSRSRWSSLSWGPRRIKQALYKKGISEADAENAIRLVFEDGELSEQEERLGLSKRSVDHLLIQASKQWFRGQDVPKETRKSRTVRWLQYRGFTWGVISFILKKLESQRPP